VGLESTILATRDGAAVLLRPGGLPEEAVARLLGRPPLRDTAPARPSAPGQLDSHYAPGAAVVTEAAERPPGALWLGFGPGSAAADATLSASGDLVEAAACLFARLRELDARAAAEGRDTIAVAPVPDVGLGRAINDRLRRAAAPRPG
jgi:L-threonylcarbamoyladenylate synthase